MFFKFKLNFILTVLLAFAAFLVPNTELYSQSKVMQVGEELEYDVSFLKIKLGKIRIVTEASENLNGKQVYKTKVYMDSYSGIPFVDLHAIFTSWMDPSISYSHKFESTAKIDASRWQFQRIGIDYVKNEILNEKWLDKTKVWSYNTKITQKINDGCSLFFLARQYTNLKKSIKIPTIIEKEVGSTSINFHGRKENVEVKSIPYSVKTLYFDGKAEWEGIYGLSGKFEGWFSDDDAHVPIKAKMNVYVGSVVIELTKWRRANWAPPKGE